MSFIRGAAVMGGCAAVGITFVLLWEAALDPWARSLTGGPTLVGEWQGELRTATGQPRVVRFVVNPLQARQRTISMTANGRMCDERGGVHEFEAWGNPRNWRGTTFWLKTRKVEDRPVGLTLGDLEGEWNRADSVRLTTTLRADPDSSTIRRGREAVSFTLLRAGEKDFAAACGRLIASSHSVSEKSLR